MKKVKIALLGLGNVGRGVYIILQKNKEEIISAVKKIYDDDEFYNKLAKNSRKLYEEKHSLYSFGVNMGKVILNELKGKQNGKEA